jgi:uncharacterized protein (DUF924 family)
MNNPALKPKAVPAFHGALLCPECGNDAYFSEKFAANAFNLICSQCSLNMQLMCYENITRASVVAKGIMKWSIAFHDKQRYPRWIFRGSPKTYQYDKDLLREVNNRITAELWPAYLVSKAMEDAS